MKKKPTPAKKAAKKKPETGNRKPEKKKPASDPSAIGSPQSAPEPPPPEPTSRKVLRARCVARFREELQSDLRKAERDVLHGPAGLGWLHNESKREEVNAWAEFLREKLAELPEEN